MSETATNEVTFAEGGMWEEAEWRIRFHEEVFIIDGAKPCRHCSPIFTKYDPAFKRTWDMFTCPRVVVAVNEGGDSSTGVCLDCILEAAVTLMKETILP
jgi:hypothetical protein